MKSTTRHTIVALTATAVTLAAIVAGSTLTAATAAAAEGPHGWDICPAVDTEPLCQIVGGANSSGTVSDTQPHVREVDRLRSNCGQVAWQHVVACPY
jgi:hypothetical protein